MAAGHLLQLWTVGNHHWYLKQQLAEAGEVVGPAWSQQHPGLLRYIVRSGGEEVLKTVQLAWSTDCGGKLATVAVVDGATVGLTPLGETVVPPPAAALQLRLDRPVRQVVFPSPGPGQGLLARAAGEGSSLLVVMDTKACLFLLAGEEGPGEGGAVQVTGAGGAGYTARCSLWRLAATLPCPALARLTGLVWSGGRLLGSTLGRPGLALLRERDGELHLEQELAVAGPAVWLLAAGPAGAITVQQEDGQMLQLVEEEEEDKARLRPAAESFPSMCDPMVVTEEGVLGLSARGQLLLGSRELAAGVTSLALHPGFLLATTTDHRLLCLARPGLGPAGEASRRVERGSRLVAAVPGSARTVLQMPRGNLEVVQPRALALAMVADLLDRASYAEAYLLARRQRIDLNLLVDHDRAAFTAGAGTFVEQMAGRPEQLNIFLADLAEVDCCAGLYSAHYPARLAGGGAAEGPGKVAAVCRQVREELERQDESPGGVASLLPVLGTLVRDGARLEEALARIRTVRGEPPTDRL
jgi:elongator complex protein 1